jgi:hypothetical protein
MRRIAVILVAAVAAIILTACGSGSTPREEPFVGQWESTGGERFSLTVEAPADGTYPVKLVAGDATIEKSATKVSDTAYEADQGWSFTMVDEDLMRVTIDNDGGSATTSFKRIGG